MFKSIKTAEELESERVARELAKQVQEKKKYLSETDYKVLPYYEQKDGENLQDTIDKRSEAREFIRMNDGN